jgi:hypothetical protein
MNRISRLATTVLVSGALGLAGLGTGTAHADPGFIEHIGPYRWCPGGPPIAVNWDYGVCHTYWIVARGHGNLDGTPIVSDGAPLDNMWEGPNPPRVPEGPCFAMWIPAPCPNG